MGLRPTQGDEERWWRELQLAASASAGGYVANFGLFFNGAVLPTLFFTNVFYRLGFCLSGFQAGKTISRVPSSSPTIRIICGFSGTFATTFSTTFSTGFSTGFSTTASLAASGLSTTTCTTCPGDSTLIVSTGSPTGSRPRRAAVTC